MTKGSNSNMLSICRMRLIVCLSIGFYCLAPHAVNAQSCEEIEQIIAKCDQDFPPSKTNSKERSKERFECVRDASSKELVAFAKIVTPSKCNLAAIPNFQECRKELKTSQKCQPAKPVDTKKEAVLVVDSAVDKATQKEETPKALDDSQQSKEKLAVKSSEVTPLSDKLWIAVVVMLGMTFLFACYALFLGLQVKKSLSNIRQAINETRGQLDILEKATPSNIVMSGFERKLTDFKKEFATGLAVLRKELQPGLLRIQPAQSNIDVPIRVPKPPVIVTNEELLSAAQTAADSAMVDGVSNDVMSLSSAVRDRMPEGMRQSPIVQQMRVCAHNSSASLVLDFNNPDFISISHSGKSWLLPNPRASYAHSFSKYYDGDAKRWPVFEKAAMCTVDANGKALVSARGKL